eukprot:9487082-Pyramimonas_sp.AAC.1
MVNTNRSSPHTRVHNKTTRHSTCRLMCVVFPSAKLGGMCFVNTHTPLLWTSPRQSASATKEYGRPTCPGANAFVAIHPRNTAAEDRSDEMSAS